MTTSGAGRRVAVVTGASSGIGEATARTLAGLGFHVVAVARRAEPLKVLADEIGGTAVVADVTDDVAVAELAAGLDRVDVLVNNAGGALGLEPVANAQLDHWRWMWETNVLGTLRVARALLPKLIESGHGLIVTITSIAAFEIYDGGSGYTSAKHAQGALHRTLRGELLGRPVRPDRNCTGHGEDRLLAGAVRRGSGQGRRGVRGNDPAGGAGHSRGDRVRRDAPVARRPGHDRHPAARSGVGYPPGRPLTGCGAPDGVTGAVLGIWERGCSGLTADIDFQVSQSTAQSQMSPSE